MEHKLNEAMHENLKALVNEPLSQAMLLRLKRAAHLASQFLSLQRHPAEGILGDRLDDDYVDEGLGGIPPPFPLPRRLDAHFEPQQQPDYVALLREFMPLLVGGPKRQPRRLCLEELMEALDLAMSVKDEPLAARFRAKIERLMAEDDDACAAVNDDPA